MNIPIAKVKLTKKEINSVNLPLKNGWLVQGPKVKEFEKKWCDFTKAKYSIAVTSCTAALELALVSIGFKQNDEAIVPAFTWISSANVVEHLGGNVCLCDIELDTFNIDINQLEKKINPKTKAIIVVHLFGLPANMDKINQIAKKYNLFVIEDAACGFGSLYKSQHVGTLGDIGCFSFHPRKAITTGEGGMITTNSKKLALALKSLRDHGAEISDYRRHVSNKPYVLPDFPYAGYNFRMTDIQAVLGSLQMDRAKKIINERKKIAKFYDIGLSKLKNLDSPIYNQTYQNSYQSYPCFLYKKKLNKYSISKILKYRNSIMEVLQTNGISTRPATHALHMLKYYKNKYKFKPSDFPNAWASYHCTISLPLYNGLLRKEQNYIINHLSQLIE